MSHVDHQECFFGAMHNTFWRHAMRRLVAYLAIRWGTEWLDVSPAVLEGWLPPNWQYLAHHELVTYLDVQGITPEHCTLS